MILAALANYYQRLQERADSSGIALPGYSQEKISFIIELTAEGDIAEVIDQRVPAGKKLLPRRLSVPQPEKRTAGIKANVLWDKTAYVLGVSATSKRTDQEHAAFKALHVEALKGTADTGLLALRRFLETWNPALYAAHPKFAAYREELLDTNLVFRLHGDPASSAGLQLLHQRPAAMALWQALQASSGSASAAGDAVQCLVTGAIAQAARLHPPIKGVDGAQSSGASIVSFNLDAFNSYGKAQGHNAPVSEAAAFAYTTALNHLLRSDVANRQRVKIGDTTVIFWAQASEAAAAAAAEDLLAAMFAPGQEDDAVTARLASVLEQVRQARPLRELDALLDDGTRIHVLGLAPNASRLSVRFWEAASLGELSRRLAQHFADLVLDPVPWRRPPTPYSLALTTAPIYNDKKPRMDDVPPQLVGELTRAILTGHAYPQSLLAALVMRFRSDGQLTPLRVALCKAVLVRNRRLSSRFHHTQEVPVSLDPGCTDPGYLLGRLFSALESLQRAALGSEVNATIRDRYYGAASATPASIFPMLLRNAQNHLSKLQKLRPGQAVNMSKDIGQIVDALPTSFPRSLPMAEQGRFAIGYFQQQQARFASRDRDGADEEIHETEGESV